MPKFNGGVSIDKKGYHVFKAGKHRDVRVHTLVAEAMLGRKLKPSEDVHHCDADKLNPEWTNLEVIDHVTHGCVSSKQAQFLKRKEQHDRQQWEAVTGQPATDAIEDLSGDADCSFDYRDEPLP